MTTARTLPLLVAATLSGAAALAYELVWVRRLGDVLGAGAYAVAVVLAIFFLGLGLGAHVAGRLADRHEGSIAVFCVLEIIVAVFGLGFPALLALGDAIYTRLAPAEWPMAGALAARATITAAVLLVPALAMGGTIPALVRHIVRHEPDVAPKMGIVYGLNTLGAAIGAFLTVFVLFPRMGVFGILAIAASMNGLAVLLALPARGRHLLPSPPEVEARREDPAVPLSSGTIAITAALTGFVSVGLEVVWTRALSARFLSSVYSFATILSAYLAALAVGSLLVPAIGNLARARPRTVAVTIALAGLSALGTIVVLSSIAPPSTGAEAAAFVSRQLRELGASIVVMIAPLALFGAAFPMLVALSHRAGVTDVGRSVGRIYLANTVGAVIAAPATAFLLLPALGVRGTTLALGSVALAHGVFVLGPRLKVPVAFATSVVLLSLVTGFGARRDLRVWRHDETDTLLAYREGIAASIAVVREADGNVFLKVGSSYRLGDARTRFAQHRQGLIPLLLHPDPKTSLFIGMGTGSSAGAAAALGFASVDVLEILPELHALLPHFSETNENLAERATRDPNVRILDVDARHFVRTTRRRYDVVVGDLFVPWRAGEGAMFTREHFVAVRDVLDEYGVFFQWLPLYQLAPEDLRRVVATFASVFEEIAGLWLYYNAREPSIALVGGSGPLRLSAGARHLLDAEGRRLLVAAGLTDPRAMAGSFVLSDGALRAMAGGAPIETVNRPLTEFLSPITSLTHQRSSARENVLAVLDGFAPIRSGGIFGEIDSESLGAIQRHQRAVTAYLAGRVADVHDDDADRAIAHYGAAYLEAPDLSFVRALLVAGVRDAVGSGARRRAEVGLEALVRVEATAAIAHFHTAELALADGDRAKAVERLRTALRIDPALAPAHELLARIGATPEPEPYREAAP